MRLPGTNSQRALFVFSFLVLAIILARLVTSQQTEVTLTGNSSSPEDRVPSPSLEDHYKWRSGSPVTVINYFSPDCPHCRELFLKEEELRNFYKDTFSLIYRHSPLPLIQPLSFEKSVIAECVFEETNEEQFFAFLKEVFLKYQREQNNNEWVKKISNSYVSNQDRFTDCVSSAGREEIERDLEVSLAHGVYGTPTIIVFVNGEQSLRLNLASSQAALRLYDSFRLLPTVREYQQEILQ